MTTAPKIDPITFEVVRSALATVAAEIKSTTMRTAYSPIIAVGGDLSTAVADAQGRVVAQGQDIPVQLGAIPRSLRLTLENYGDRPLEEGEVLISNDPYLTGSNHLNDVCMVMPVYADGRLIAYTVSRSHWMDIGGHTFGGFSVRVWDIYAEGLRIPSTVAYRDYEPVEGIFKLILANVRGSEERLWDFRAQFAGCLVGERSVKRLCAKYGADMVEACMEQSLDYSERRLRAEVEKIPDGDYEFHDWIEGDGWEDRPHRLQVTIRVRGSDVEFDYTGTGPQTRGGVNAPRSITDGVSIYALKAVADYTIPSNAGLERVVRVTVPEATVLNPVPPAACSTGGTGETAQRLADLLMGAFAQAVPERVVAGSYASAMVAMISGRDPIPWRRALLHRDSVVVMDNAPGGYGARPEKDGVNGIKVHTGNAKETPAELIEFTTPVRVRRWQIVTDTGGPGRNRGGCAAFREYEVIEEATAVTLQGERVRVPPFGLAGGKAGAVGRMSINDEALPSKNPPLMLNVGDRVHFQPAGGGGYGSPLDREPLRVLDDVLDGYVSERSARDDYGVVLRDGQVDLEATVSLREQMRAGAGLMMPIDRGISGYAELNEAESERT
jgi:N-methylhydantoinase B